MNNDIDFTYYARPACLHHHDAFQVKPPMTITGWKEWTDKNTMSGWLIKTYVNETEFKACKTKYDSLRLKSLPHGLQKASQLCASGEIQDQGIAPRLDYIIGPLQYQILNMKSHNDIGYIYGVFSLGSEENGEKVQRIFYFSHFKFLFISTDSILRFTRECHTISTGFRISFGLEANSMSFEKIIGKKWNKIFKFFIEISPFIN